MIGEILLTDYHGNPGKITINGVIDAAALKALTQHLDNYTVAAIKGYRTIPELSTDANSIAVNDTHGYIKDRFIVTFDVVKVALGPVDSMVLTIPAPDSTKIVESEENRILAAADGLALAGFIKTATGFDQVIYTGSKFKSAIVKG